MNSTRPNPKVSVMICAFNAADYLPETLESVFQQSFADYEVVIVDDGSTDATGDIGRAAVGRGRVVYHRQENAGFGAARNKALQLAKGEWIAIIDADDICLPARLERQVAAAARHPEAALHFSDSEHFRDDGTVVRRQFDLFDPCGLDLGPGRGAELLLTRGNFVDSETAFFRKDAALEVGGFPTQFRYVNDYDFFLRLAERWRIHGEPDVLARWRLHDRQLTQTHGDIIVKESISLLKEWRTKGFVSPSTRRVIDMKVMAYLLRAATRGPLRRELGLTALLGEAASLLPAARQGPALAFDRLLERIVR